jgi:hypothetical protein
MVYQSTVRIVARNVICNDMIVALKLKAEPEIITIVHANIRIWKWGNGELYDISEDIVE